MENAVSWEVKLKPLEKRSCITCPSNLLRHIPEGRCEREYFKRLIGRYPHPLLSSVEEKTKGRMSCGGRAVFLCLRWLPSGFCANGRWCDSSLQQQPLTCHFCADAGVLRGQWTSLRNLRGLTFSVLVHNLLYNFYFWLELGWIFHLLGALCPSVRGAMWCRSLKVQVATQEADCRGCVFLYCALPAKALYSPACCRHCWCVVVVVVVVQLPVFILLFLQNWINSVDSVPWQEGNACAPVLANPA